MFTLHNGDCLEYMKTLAPASVDCIVTDPPYGIAFRSNGAKENRYDVIHGDYDFDLSPYFAEMLRITKEGGAIYLYTRWDIAYEWQKIVEPDSQIIIPRGRVGMGDLDDYADEYEVVLFRRIGNHAIDASALKIPNNSHAKNPPKYKVRIGNIWSELKSNEAWERAEHPTQKTVSSFAKMIQVSTKPGDKVFDPFMGLGSSGVASVQHGRVYVGCEIDPVYFSKAEKRVKSAALQPSFLTPSNNRLHPDVGDSPAQQALFTPEADSAAGKSPKPAPRR